MDPCEALEAYLQSLPDEPWDVFTDTPRDNSQASRQAVDDVHPVSLPLSKVDRLDALTAFCVALGAYDVGRASLWVWCAVEDSSAEALPELPPLPVRAKLGEGSVEDVRGRLGDDLAHLASIGRSLGRDAVSAALERAAPPQRFAARQAHAVCQAAFGVATSNDAYSQEPDPDFALRVEEGVAQLRVRADLYDQVTVARVAKHLVSLLRSRQSWGATSMENAASLMADASEEELVLHGWNSTAAPYQECACIHHLFEGVARGPCAERVAVVPADARQPSWTYRQLDLAAGAVARALTSLGMPPGERVAQLQQRSPRLVAGIYGILRAGHAYVPLDTGWPSERQCFIVQNVRAAALVLDGDSAAPVGCDSVPLVRVTPTGCGAGEDQGPLQAVAEVAQGDGAGAPLPDVADVAQSSDTSVYILFTSGTTGKPKGVDVPHRGLVGRTEWLQNTWPLDADSAMVQKTPTTFAISEWELFWPLCFGARLVLAADGLHGDSQHIAELLAEHRVSHSVFVPSLLEQYLEELNGTPAPDLKLIIACGEALKSPTAFACRKGLPDTELVNLYGPTEGSMTMLRIPDDPSPKDLLRFPIGCPIENTKVLCIRDSKESSSMLPPAPVLVQGELYFGGPLLARGYWELSELTSSLFVKNPHHAGRLYRTGDMGRWRADGTLEFLGRIDNQVKFNGVRIELGELESAMEALPLVKTAAAFLSPPHLVGACVLHTPATDDGAVPKLAQELLSALRQHLPKDRVPTKLEILPSLPLTERGKLDRKLLVRSFEDREKERAAEAQLKADGDAEHVDPGSLPVTPAESFIHEAMQQILGVSGTLPVTAQFQEIGFSSLMLGKLTSRVRRHFCLAALPATAVYTHPTARDLAAHMDKLQDTVASSTGQDGDGELVVRDPGWRGLSPTSPLSILCTIVGIALKALVCEFAFIPAYYAMWHVYFKYGMGALVVVIGPIFMFDQYMTVLVHILLKWLIIGRHREGRYPVYGWYYWKWWFVNNIEKYTIPQVCWIFADTALYTAILRLLGAKMGPGVRVNTLLIRTVDLVTAGPGARICDDAVVHPVRFWSGELQLQRIVIGSNSETGPCAFVTGGTSVSEASELTTMTASDPWGAHHATDLKPTQQPSTSWALDCLQICLGLPIICIVEGLSQASAAIAMEWYWKFLSRRWRSHGGGSPRGRGRGDKGRGRSKQRGWPTDEAGRGRGDKGRGRGRRTTEEGPALNAVDMPRESRRASYTLGRKRNILYPFIAGLASTMIFLTGFSFFVCVVVIKRFLVGSFKEGPVVGPWDEFRRWLLQRLVTSMTFTQFMELWINTEILSCCYRLLGAKIAPRVNIDFFSAVEYDLITVEKDVVFGSNVHLINTHHGYSRPITIKRGACVLDRSCVTPGTSIPEGVILGSFTVVAPEQKLETMSVYTGCQGGQGVRLFRRPMLRSERIEGDRVVTVSDVKESFHSSPRADLPPAAIKQRALEAQALRRHESMFWFTLFNTWCALSAFLFAPMADIIYWSTLIIDFEVYDLYKDSEYGEVISLALMAPGFIVVTMLIMIMMIALKWLVIGEWTAGDRPYYGRFHFLWAALMLALTSLHEVEQTIAGTFIANLFLRCMGAKVGKRVCFFGHGFEYDLLEIGDDVCIGPECDVTTHTVENMVLKLEHVKFSRGASCLNGSVVMPGGTMEPWSTLTEHSQVLKGDVVPEGHFFGGLPAKLLRGHPVCAAAAGAPLSNPAGAAVPETPLGAVSTDDASSGSARRRR